MLSISKNILFSLLILLLSVSCNEMTQKAKDKLNEVKKTRESVDSLIEKSTSKVDSLTNSTLKIIE